MASTPVLHACLLCDVISLYAIRQTNIEFMSRCLSSLSALQKVLARGTGPELTLDFRGEIILTE